MHGRFPVEPKIGQRVELIHCADVWTRLRPGTMGTVKSVDENGVVHVQWDPTFKERYDGTRQVIQSVLHGLVFDCGDKFRLVDQG